MKKLLILLLGVAVYTTAQAQTTEDARRVILGEEKRKTNTEQPTDIFGRKDEGRVYRESEKTSSKSKSYKSKKRGKYNNPGKRLGWEKGVGNPHRTGAVQSKKYKHAGKGKGKKS